MILDLLASAWPVRSFSGGPCLPSAYGCAPWGSTFYEDIPFDLQVQAVVNLRCMLSPEKLAQKLHSSHPGHLRHLSSIEYLFKGRKPAAWCFSTFPHPNHEMKFYTWKKITEYWKRGRLIKEVQIWWGIVWLISLSNLIGPGKPNEEGKGRWIQTVIYSGDEFRQSPLQF